VHSVTKAAIAPIAARAGATTAPITPRVNGTCIISLPFLSLIIILLIFPAFISSLTFSKSFVPSTLKVSSLNFFSVFVL